MPLNVKRLELGALSSTETRKQPALPDFPVVYIIFSDELIFYVGATRSLFNRWSAHSCDWRMKPFLKRRTTKVAWIPAAMEQLGDFESALIRFLNPKLNSKRKGKTYFYRGVPNKQSIRRRLEIPVAQHSTTNGNGHK